MLTSSRDPEHVTIGVHNCPRDLVQLTREVGKCSPEWPSLSDTEQSRGKGRIIPEAEAEDKKIQKQFLINQCKAKRLRIT